MSVFFIWYVLSIIIIFCILNLTGLTYLIRSVYVYVLLLNRYNSVRMHYILFYDRIGFQKRLHRDRLEDIYSEQFTFNLEVLNIRSMNPTLLLRDRYNSTFILLYNHTKINLFIIGHSTNSSLVQFERISLLEL